MEAYLLPISIGFFFGLFSGLTAILVSLRAAARVAKLEATLAGLEWDQVASLTLDIEKLKKHAQKWTNNANAEMKTTGNSQLRLLADQMLQAPSVPNQTKVGG
jgi:hypothetical protein